MSDTLKGLTPYEEDGKCITRQHLFSSDLKPQQVFTLTP